MIVIGLCVGLRARTGAPRWPEFLGQPRHCPRARRFARAPSSAAVVFRLRRGVIGADGLGGAVAASAARMLAVGAWSGPIREDTRSRSFRLDVVRGGVVERGHRLGRQAGPRPGLVVSSGAWVCFAVRRAARRRFAARHGARPREVRGAARGGAAFCGAARLCDPAGSGAPAHGAARDPDRSAAQPGGPTEGRAARGATVFCGAARLTARGVRGVPEPRRRAGPTRRLHGPAGLRTGRAARRGGARSAPAPPRGKSAAASVFAARPGHAAPRIRPERGGSNCALREWAECGWSARDLDETPHPVFNPPSRRPCVPGRPECAVRAPPARRPRADAHHAGRPHRTGDRRLAAGLPAAG